MSHYAKVLNGKVVQVIVAEKDFFNTFIDTSPGEWIQTSYNTRGGVHYAPDSNTPDDGIALRANYAGIGYTYDAKNDVFYAPRPLDMNNIVCESWTISSPSWLWTPPTPYPTDGKHYVWNETTKVWVEQLINNN